MEPGIVVMGVSGSGKSRVGAALAEALGFDFVDGDDLHPTANIAKMAGWTPLTDADQARWLEAALRDLSRAGQQRTWPAGAILFQHGDAGADEDAIMVDIAPDPANIVQMIRNRLESGLTD